MKVIFTHRIFVLMAIVLLNVGCDNDSVPGNKPVIETTLPKSDSSKLVITNPNFVIAPVEYSTLNEKALNLLSKFEFDAWGDMLSDNVTYAFPDGDVDTRTTLKGKDAVLAWWKQWKEKSGIESMTMSEFNHTPINVVSPIKGGATMGIYDIAYFSNKMIFKGKTAALRMNFVAHFNADKKIDRYNTYYDRSVIIKASGKNILEELKTQK